MSAETPNWSDGRPGWCLCVCVRFRVCHQIWRYVQYCHKVLTDEDVAKPWCCHLHYGQGLVADLPHLLAVKLQSTESHIQTGCVSKTITYWNFCFSQHLQHHWFNYIMNRSLNDKCCHSQTIHSRGQVMSLHYISLYGRMLCSVMVC